MTTTCCSTCSKTSTRMTFTTKATLSSTCRETSSVRLTATRRTPVRCGGSGLSPQCVPRACTLPEKSFDTSQLILRHRKTRVRRIRYSVGVPVYCRLNTAYCPYSAGEIVQDEYILRWGFPYGAYCIVPVAGIVPVLENLGPG